MSRVAEHPGRKSVSSEVDALIDRFVPRCLESGFDIVVALESEGVALLMPYLIDKTPAEYPMVIPATALHASRMKIKGKRVLLFDASAVSAERVCLTRRKIEHLAEEVTSAVLVLHEDCPKQSMPDWVGLKLDGRSFSWAKARLTERSLERPFPLDGDHLILHFRFAPGTEVQTFLDAAKRVGMTYVVGDLASPIARFTVDNIAVRERTKFPTSLWFESVCKVRLFVDPVRNSLSVVPVLFPGVPLKNDSVDTCPFCEFSADVIGPYSSHKGVSERCFRKVGLKASVLLAESFMRRFMSYLPADAGLELTAVPDVLRGCWALPLRNPGPVVSQIYERMARLLDDLANGSQLPLEEHPFEYRSEYDEVTKYGLVENGRQPHLTSPWVSTAIQVAQWYEEIQAENGHEMRKDRCGVSYSELCSRMSKELHPVLVSYSYDVLIDEGVLRPQTVVGLRPDSSEPYLVRGYTLAGEFVREQLLSTAAFQRRDKDWFRAHTSSPTRSGQR